MANDNEVIEQIKSETKTGISQVIAKIFESAVEPFLDGIDLLKSVVRRCYENYKIKKTMYSIINKNLLEIYLEKHNLNCFMLTTHNGQHSESGLGKKYINPEFVYTTLSDNNLLDVLCSNESPLHLYAKWLYFCMQGRSFEKQDFTEKMQAYFEDYNYVFFRKYRVVFYVIMSKDRELTNEHERYINTIIDNFLDK